MLASNAYVASIQLGVDDGEIAACRVDRGLAVCAGRGWDEEDGCSGHLASSLSVVGTRSGRLAAFYPRKLRAGLNPWDLSDLRYASVVLRHTPLTVTVSPDEVLPRHCRILSRLAVSSWAQIFVITFTGCCAF